MYIKLKWSVLTASTKGTFCHQTFEAIYEIPFFFFCWVYDKLGRVCLLPYIVPDHYDRKVTIFYYLEHCNNTVYLGFLHFISSPCSTLTDNLTQFLHFLGVQ